MKNKELIELLREWPLDAEVLTVEITEDNDFGTDWQTPGVRLMEWGVVAFYHPWNAYVVDEADEIEKRRKAEEAQRALRLRAEEDEILRRAEAILARRANLTGA